jgi:hypothetical protein
MSVDGIINEQNTNFVGKDGFYWWVGEVEDNEDPLNVGRVKVRVLNYYTDPNGQSNSNLPTKDLPWATVLHTTAQAGNDGQGESSGQLQPGAIVMGFFLDGESAQMPVVMGVLRTRKGEQSTEKQFLFTGQDIPEGIAPNASKMPIGSTNTISSTNSDPVDNNSVSIPNSGIEPGSAGSPNGIGNAPGITGSAMNSQKPTTPSKPIPAASGTGGPWKMLEYKLTYLVEDLAASAGNLVRSDDGNFIDVIENKVISADKLLAKAKNFLGAVFAQLISALRQELDALAQAIALPAETIASFLGIPGGTFTAINTAISAILSAICALDGGLAGYIDQAIGSLLDVVMGVVDGLISQAEAAMQGVQEMIDSIICTVQDILGQVLSVIDTVKSIVDIGGQAKEIIDAWQSGSQIFSAGMDVMANGITNLTGLLTLFLSLFDFGCDREASGGKGDVGWYPFFGTTACTPAALGALPLGSGYGQCGGGSGGGFMDSFFEEADPYLTTAKNFINGAYELQFGTPGRQATVKKDSSGKTTTSIKSNNSSLADFKAKKKFREENPDLSSSEVDEQVKKYRKKASGTESDQENFVSDHTSFPGNHTQEVHGDDCKTIDGDYCRTIDGDYRLKITGDCHIEVGGGFFMNAQGAAKTVDNEGKEAEDSGTIQKHTINFGSDLDLNTAGAGIKVNCVNFELGARDCKVSGSSYENLYSTFTHSGGEHVINAGNAITMSTSTLTQDVNISDPVGLGGYTCAVGGPITFVQSPAAVGGLPPFTITTPGPFVANVAAAGAAFNVGAGAFKVNVAAGLVSLTASGACTMDAGGAMTLTAGAVMKLTATSIFLN